MRAGRAYPNFTRGPGYFAVRGTAAGSRPSRPVSPSLHRSPGSYDVLERLQGLSLQLLQWHDLPPQKSHQPHKLADYGLGGAKSANSADFAPPKARSPAGLGLLWPMRYLMRVGRVGRLAAERN